MAGTETDVVVIRNGRQTNPATQLSLDYVRISLSIGTRPKIGIFQPDFAATVPASGVNYRKNPLESGRLIGISGDLT